MANSNRNDYVVEETGGLTVNADHAMEQFKTEVAAELGLRNYNQLDKGWLSSRQNGYVGGNMVKKMIAYTEQVIAQQGAQTMNAVRSTIEVTPEVKRLNELASQNFNGYVQALQSGNLGQIANQTAAGIEELH